MLLPSFECVYISISLRTRQLRQNWITPVQNGLHFHFQSTFLPLDHDTCLRDQRTIVFRNTALGRRVGQCNDLFGSWASPYCVLISPSSGKALTHPDAKQGERGNANETQFHARIPMDEKYKTDQLLETLMDSTGFISVVLGRTGIPGTLHRVGFRHILWFQARKTLI